MTDPINLNKARKAKARSEKEKRAAENRVKFGRTKAQKAVETKEADRIRQDVDFSKREH